MKFFLVLLLFVCTHTVFAQEETVYLTTQTTDTSLRYDPHSLGISFRMGSVISEGTYYGVQNTVFEFYTQGRKGKTKYTPMVGIRLSSPLGGLNSYSYGGFRWGFLFGGSQYVFDKRSEETGKGWSMLVNGGVTADLPNIKEFKEITNYPLTLGAEMEFKTIYNIHKYVGVSFGLHMAYTFGFSVKTLNSTISGTPVGENEALVKYDHSFTIGLNFGVIF